MQDGILQGSHEQMMEEYAKRYKKICIENNSIDGKLFDEFGVKRGLRDKNGKGVLSGITIYPLLRLPIWTVTGSFRVKVSFFTEDTIFMT